MTPPRTDLSAEIPQRVMLSQLLWTAGHSLTSGSFLAFFLFSLMKHSYSALAMSLLFAIPDIMGISGTLANVFVRIFGSRKQAWIYSTLISRGIFVLLPLLIFIPRQIELGSQLMAKQLLPAYFMLIFVGTSWFFQNIAFVNLITWITELYPQKRWNSLFGKWEFARVGILIFIPGLAAFLKYVGGHLSDYGLANLSEFGFYGMIFVFGCSLQVLSLTPLLKYPAEFYRPTLIEHSLHDSQPTPKVSIWELLKDHSICCTILGSWWLAFFQGLTQSVFFTHASQSLGITLEMYIILNSTLYTCQAMLCFPSIFIMNRLGARKVYFVSLILVSLSLICWFYSTKSTWWLLIIAYLLWGFFAPVNIAGSALICKLSREKNQALSFAMFRTVAGVFAGLSGIYGGYLLETALKTRELFGYDIAQLQYLGLSPFQVIVLISLVGRITAPLWLIWVREPIVITKSASDVYPTKESPV